MADILARWQTKKKNVPVHAHHVRRLTNGNGGGGYMQVQGNGGGGYVQAQGNGLFHSKTVQGYGWKK